MTGKRKSARSGVSGGPRGPSLATHNRIAIVPDGRLPRAESADDVHDLEDSILRRLVPGPLPHRLQGRLHFVASHALMPIVPQCRDDLPERDLHRAYLNLYTCLATPVI